MQRYTSDQKFHNILESTVPVLRNGRQVLAVKSNQQNSIPGIIHEVSQTAKTVYIEPEEAVRCSNELVQKENELLQVINRILTELTSSLRPYISAFEQSLPLMTFFDTTLAAAKWGMAHVCVYAQSIKDRSLPPFLLQARHPLLGDKAVPIDIRFMEGKRVLIITGPNTGGKTVTLKTFALLSMLNQAGFPIPCAEGTMLPVFHELYADIGDEQSLDQNLSTFSGHMKNIAEAVMHADENTLVLLDELGSVAGDHSEHTRGEGVERAGMAYLHVLQVQALAQHSPHALDHGKRSHAQRLVHMEHLTQDWVEGGGEGGVHHERIMVTMPTMAQ